MLKKILLIDDEDIVVKTIHKLLTKTGYQVVSCASGTDAINAISLESFDLVISDIRMPNLNGVETIKRIRVVLLSKKAKPVPEILMSGFADPQTIKDAEKLGAKDFFYKPFDLGEFLASVKRALGDA